MKLQVKQADSKLQETLKQMSLTLANVKELGLLLRDTGHSPDVKRVETYLSKAKDVLTTTAQTLKDDLAQHPDLPTSEPSETRPPGQLPRWTLLLIGTLCGAGIFALGTAGIAAIFGLSGFLEQSAVWWFGLALLLEAGAAWAAGYITATLAPEHSKRHAALVGGLLAALAALLFGYPTAWHTLHLLTPLLGSSLGGFSVAPKPSARQLPPSAPDQSPTAQA